jgi:hypothetical protein
METGGSQEGGIRREERRGGRKGVGVRKKESEDRR